MSAPCISPLFCAGVGEQQQQQKQQRERLRREWRREGESYSATFYTSSGFMRRGNFFISLKTTRPIVGVVVDVVVIVVSRMSVRSTPPPRKRSTTPRALPCPCFYSFFFPLSSTPPLPPQFALRGLIATCTFCPSNSQKTHAFICFIK